MAPFFAVGFVLASILGGVAGLSALAPSVHAARAPLQPAFARWRAPPPCLCDEGPPEGMGPMAAVRESLLGWKSKVEEEPLAAVKEAGVAGAISYTAVELTFFAVTLPIGYVLYHTSTGEWLDLSQLLSDGEGRVRILGLLFAYIVLLKTFFPLRLGATLLVIPRTRQLLESAGWL